MKFSDLSVEQIYFFFQILGIFLGAQIATSLLFALGSFLYFQSSCNIRDFIIMSRRAKRIRKRREDLERKGYICDIYGNKKGEQGN